IVQVDVQHAAAIDAALGDAAQAVVITGGAGEIQSLISAASDLGGRVVVIGDQPTEDLGPIELSADMALGVNVIARADKLVDCPDGQRPLITRLLGRTFVVGSLDDALRLLNTAPAGTRAVTLEGEFVDEHGAIAFGPRQAGTSLVSRRSQLRAAHLDLAVLDQQITDAQRETAHLKREIERHEQAVRQLQEAGKALDQQAAIHAAAIESLTQRRAQLRRQQETTKSSLAESVNRCQSIEATLRQTIEQLQDAQAGANAVHASLAGREQELRHL